MKDSDEGENVTPLRPDPPRLEDADPASLIKVGGPVDDVKVHIRFFGDDLDPDEVSYLLGAAPSDAFRKGDPMPGQYQRVAKTGRWGIDGDYAINDVEDQVNHLLDRLTDDLAAWEEVTRRFAADVFCGLFLHDGNRGFSLSDELCRRLADRRLPIGFDIYTV